MKKLLLCLVVLSVGACSGKTKVEKNAQSPSEATPQSYAYSLEDPWNDVCVTGKHEFSSKPEFCEGLKSQSLNDYCAVAAREALFKNSNCPGVFETSN